MTDDEINRKLALAPAAEIDGEPPARDRVRYQPETHRLLPQSAYAEQGVLSSFLLAPRETGAVCTEHHVTPEFFHIPAHGLIFRELMALWLDNKPIDFITLTEHLNGRGILDDAGGAAFITNLFTFLPTAANLGHYLSIVDEKFTLRSIIKTATEFAGRAYDEQDRAPEVLDEFESRVLAIRSGNTATQIYPAKQVVFTALDQLDQVWRNRGAITGIATGFADLDKLTDGLHRGEMIVIAARPSQGKSAIAMNMADFIAVDLKLPVGVFSLEMSKEQLTQRMLCSRARVNLAQIRDGFVRERDFPALAQAAHAIAESPLYFHDSSNLSIQELRAKARRMRSEFGVEAIFIDYLQLLTSTTKRAQENRQQEVTEISKGTKALAKELNIPVVVLAQLSRKFDDRAMHGRPRLSDLRESGAIEADADVIGFLVRPETYAEDEEDRIALAGKAELMIAKQRNGPLADVPLTFLKEFTRFETRARAGEEQSGGQGQFNI